MKEILILAFLPLFVFSSNLFAAGVEELSSIPVMDSKSDNDWSGMLGLAALSAPEYVGGDDEEGAGLPLIVVDYKDIAYFKVNTLGVWLWKPNDSFRIGLAAKQRRGWESEDGPLFTGRAERDAQTEAGINFLWKVEDFSVEGLFLSASSESEGSSALIKARYTYQVDDKWTVVGGLDFESLDEDIVKYYYGTDGTFGGDSVYTGDSTTNSSFLLMATYNINKEWVALGGFKATSLGDEIKDSPLTEDDSYNVAFAGAAWKF